VALRGGVPFDQPLVDLELDEGERIIYIGRRHWIELLQTALVFILMFVVAGGLALYRLVGGTFLRADAGEPGFDLFGIVVLSIVAVLSFFWWRAVRQQQSKTKRPGARFIWLYPTFIVLLLAAFWFHFQGGRIFNIDPIDATGLDGWNGLLLFLAALGLGATIYFYIDWKDDFLVVTNTRVVYDDEQFLVRHVQQQILINDIQQVNLRANNYIEYWLNFGTIILRSYANQPLTFLYADNPKATVDAIQGEINKLRKAEEPELLRRMIEEQVYNNKQVKPAPPHIYVKQGKSLLPWLFSPNPEINGETIKWRPYWLVIILHMLQPFGIWLAVTISTFIAASFGISMLGLSVLWVIVTLAMAGWIYWIREEFDNDVYILNRQNIIDVDRRPFGPENSRRAPLSSIQDISFDISFVESVLGYGTVIIKTGGAGGGDFTFTDVPDPRNVQATINDYLTDYKKGEKERQMKDTLAMIQAYHSVQVAHQEVATPEIIAKQIADHVASEIPKHVATTVREEVSRAVNTETTGRMRRNARRQARDAMLRELRRQSSQSNNEG
jgi:hypothetical protein